MITLVPAYGHDYKTEEEAIEAWKDNKDFIIADIMHPHSGRYINLQDALHFGGVDQVKIRFNKLTQIAVVKVT